MSDILQKLIPMFIGAEGSFSTPLMQEYTPYVDNKIVVNDTSVLPDVPNLVTIYSPSDPKHFCVIKYETKTDTVLSGLTVLYGHPYPAVKFKMGSFASRKYTVYDHDTFVKNISMLYNLLLQIIQDSSIIDASIDNFQISIPSIVTVNYTPSIPQSFIHSEKYSAYITQLTFEQPNGSTINVTPSSSDVSVDFDPTTVFSEEGQYVYTLSGIDITNKSFEKTVSVTAMNYGYIGASQSPVITDFTGLQMFNNGQTTFEFTTSQNDYIWVCLADGYILSELTSFGFGIPMQPPIVVTKLIGDVTVSYNCYRSSEQIIAGDNVFKISVEAGPVVVVPTIARFEISIPPMVPVGSSYIGQYTFSHAETYPNNIAELQFIQPDNTSQSVVPSDTLQTVNFNSNIVFTNLGNYTYQLKGTDILGHEILSQIIVTTTTNGWIGVSSDNPLTSIDGFLQTNIGENTYNLISRDNDYIWVCLTGGQELIKLTSFGFSVPFEEAGTIEISQSGVSVTYNCWRSSEQILSGSNDITATIENTGYGTNVPTIEMFALDVPNVVEIGYELIGTYSFNHMETYIDQIESLVFTQPNGQSQVVSPNDSITQVNFESNMAFNESKDYVYTLSGITVNGVRFESKYIVSTLTYDGLLGASSNDTLTSVENFKPISNTQTEYSVYTNDNDYIWICLKEGYSLVSVTSVGFSVPFDSAGTYVDNSGDIPKTYNCWRSSEQLIAGNNNITITIKSD